MDSDISVFNKGVGLFQAHGL